MRILKRISQQMTTKVYHLVNIDKSLGKSKVMNSTFNLIITSEEGKAHNL